MSRNNTVLAFSCLHLPVEHPKAFEFLKELKKKYKPNVVMNLGDTFDVATPSRHGGNPDIYSASDEIELCRELVYKYTKLFPKMLICESNHTQRYYRWAKRSGLPMAIIKSINDIYGLPETWRFSPEWVLGRTVYRHGQGCATAFTNACNNACNFVQGHLHSKLECQHRTAPFNAFFGATVGCLCDPKAETMKYGIYSKHRPVLGAVIIKDDSDVETIRMNLT